MQLDKLKRNMSTLERLLEKTDKEIRIDTTTSATARTRLLKKFRGALITCLSLAVVFGCSAIANINPESFPLHLKIFLVVILLLACIWYTFMYLELKRTDVFSLPPARLFSKTAMLKLWMLSGEIVFAICMAVFFTLLFPHAWQYHRFGFWAMAVSLVIAIAYTVVRQYPQYIRLFRDLDSIKE